MVVVWGLDDDDPRARTGNKERSRSHNDQQTKSYVPDHTTYFLSLERHDVLIRNAEVEKHCMTSPST